MEDWKGKEGIIPEKEPYKKGRGFVLWAVLALVSYYLIFNRVSHMIMAGLLSKYKATSWMPPAASMIYYVVCPVAKYICAFIFAFIVKSLINVHIASFNKKALVKNAAILKANEEADSAVQATMNPTETLVARLTKGKMELAKYEPFLRKKDFYHSFYYWDAKKALLVGVLSFLMTRVAAYIIAWIVAIVLSIGYMIAGQTPDQAVGSAIIQMMLILSIVMSVGICIGSFPFAALCRKKADKLQAEDDTNGYTHAINRVIPDVPMRYRRIRLMNKLIRITRKKNYTTVDESITSYERAVRTKEGIVAVIGILIIFGIFNAINNSLNESEQMMKASADDVCRRMDESREESQRIRESDRMTKQKYNEYGAARRYADNSMANARKLRTPGAAQYANQAKKYADDLQRRL